MIPFSRGAFLDAFQAYNASAWPAQVALTGFALVAVVAAFRGTRRASALAGTILAALWCWMAVAYHWIHFVRVTAAAWIFGAMFLGQALLLVAATVRGTLRFGAPSRASAVIGLAIIGYALVGYPLLGMWSDHAYPRAPTFGLPCPTTIFTLGMLLLTTRRVPRPLLVVPVLWAAIAMMAAVKLGSWEDLGLALAAALVCIGLAIRVRFARASSTVRCHAVRSEDPR